MEPAKSICTYCGRNVYYACSNANEAFAICRLGELASPERSKVPSAYTDEAYSQNVYKPHHYAKWKVEPITFIMENDLPYAVGNVIKYVMRYKDKNVLEDLKKARRYIDMIIEMEYGKDSV